MTYKIDNVYLTDIARGYKEINRKFMEIVKNRFPQVYSEIDTGYLVDVFDSGPDRLKKSLAELKEKDLRAYPRPGKWSVFEIVIHLADAELVGAARVRKVFSQPGDSCLTYDQEMWAKYCDYSGMDIFDFKNAITQFEVLRCSTSRIFHKARKNDWYKTGTHPDYGTITLRQLLELYADHSERHISQILQSRDLLRKPVDIKLMLEERLY